MASRAFAAVRRRRLSATAAMGLALVVVLLASLALGSNPISPARVVQALLDPANDPDSVVWGSRVPRTVLGLVVGFCLGVSGVVMQGQTGNPLADPGLFGVSAGASLAVVLGAFLLGHNSMTASLLLAMAGALVASVLVFTIGTLSRDLANPVPLAIAGTAVSALLGAVISFLVLTNQSSLEAYRVWVVGSLSGRGLDGLLPALLMASVGLVLAVLNARSLNSLTLGTELAQGLGETLWRARLVGLAGITLTSASAVALAGPIGFIGLTAPHLGRTLVGGNHFRLLPASGLIGAVTLLACDVVGRLIGGQAEVPVGVVLATLGGVAFVAIVRRTTLAAL
ncbi:FecCD family ABC transporter permease [Micropruina sp.]|uniref:FecCD family ABC transporter permease n=1 Tax=Micropruina sp. TaxID=2737536 RepID=UPI0039E38AED